MRCTRQEKIRTLSLVLREMKEEEDDISYSLNEAGRSFETYIRNNPRPLDYVRDYIDERKFDRATTLQFRRRFYVLYHDILGFRTKCRQRVCYPRMKDTASAASSRGSRSLMEILCLDEQTRARTRAFTYTHTYTHTRTHG